MRPRGSYADVGQRALFAPETLAAPPSPVNRLRRQAATQADEDGEVLARLRTMAAALAAHFTLRYSAVDAEAEGVVQHYGICYADGRIRIRLRHATTGRLLKESSLVDTLCHELAHLKHFDHSLRFRRFHEKVLLEARRRGWYKPRPTPAPPREAPLWDDLR